METVPYKDQDPEVGQGRDPGQSHDVENQPSGLDPTLLLHSQHDNDAKRLVDAQF